MSNLDSIKIIKGTVEVVPNHGTDQSKFHDDNVQKKSGPGFPGPLLLVGKGIFCRIGAVLIQAITGKKFESLDRVHDHGRLILLKRRI